MADDANNYQDVFVRDLWTGRIRRVSVSSAGEQGNFDSGFFAPAMSADGRFVAFQSPATNLVAGDTNSHVDVFIRDLGLGTTARVSVNSAGKQGSDWSMAPVINANGRYIAFAAAATNMVSSDTNGFSDIFVRDRLLNTAQNADIALTVTHQPSSVVKGQSADYSFTISNNGPDAAEEVALTDVIGNGAVATAIPSQGKCFASKVSVCRFGTLAAGASATLTLSLKAGFNPLTQKISVSAAPKDGVPANNRATLTTPVTP